MGAALRVSPSSSGTLDCRRHQPPCLGPAFPAPGYRPGREMTASMPKSRRPKRLPLGSDDRPDRPENLPQGIEMLDFTPGFSAPPGSRRSRRTAARATPRLRPARSGAGTARADDRPENLPQGIEMLDFTPGIFAPPGSRRPRRTAARPTPRLRRARSGAGTARADDRPENLPQGIEMLDFAPGFSAPPGSRRWRRTAARLCLRRPRQGRGDRRRPTLARKIRRKALITLNPRPGFVRGHGVRLAVLSAFPNRARARTRNVRASLKGEAVRRATAARALVWLRRPARAMGAFPFCRLGRSP